MSVLNRTAEALNCRLAYVLVPKEPLDHMVRRQARDKARELASLVEAEVAVDDRALVAEVIDEDLDVLRTGLWTVKGYGGKAERISEDPCCGD